MFRSVASLKRLRKTNYLLHRQIENASRSPLFRLPPELRIQVYELVIGEPMVHVRTHNNPECEEPSLETEAKPQSNAKTPFEPFHVRVEQCRAKFSELEAWKASTHIDPEDEFGLWSKSPLALTSYRERHRYCYREASAPDVSLLLVCSTVYQETRSMFYAQTMFYFESPRAIERFILLLKPWEKSAVKTIHLEVDRMKANPRFEIPDTITMLSGLRNLHLWVAPSLDISKSQIWQLLHRKEIPLWTEGLSKFQLLALKNVSVIVEDKGLSYIKRKMQSGGGGVIALSLDMGGWTCAERLELAKLWCAKLLAKPE